jgi:hypothetical protein
MRHYNEGEGIMRARAIFAEFLTSSAHPIFYAIGRFAPDMMLWCERFGLVERIGD